MQSESGTKEDLQEVGGAGRLIRETAMEAPIDASVEHDIPPNGGMLKSETR